MRRERRGSAIRSACAAAAAVAILATPAEAFDSKGHVVIEALAYRTLIEGHDGRPPQPDVLRDLVNDGALAPPICFGFGANPPGYCVGAATENPLLEWPHPETDRPDAAFRRQFSDPGQCFHFMAPLEDGASAKIPGTSIPRALATSAIVRCRSLLDGLLRQIVIEGGPGTRRSAYGLYELMHAVGDSFSGAHSERRPGSREIESLRVWGPLARLPGMTTEKQARIPKTAYHKWDDHRDKEYVVEDRDAGGGRRCKQLTNHPYEVPFACLSEQGDQARQSLVELLVVVHDLRQQRLASPAETDPAPELSEAWRAYKQKWFAAAHACQGAECEAKQPADPLPGAYGLVGLDTSYNATRKFFDLTARGTLLRYSWELNPFIYAVSANLGLRRFNSGTSSGLAGLELDLLLPLGKRASLGFSPAALRVAFGGQQTGSDVATRLFRFDLRVGERMFLTVNGPIEVNWRKPAVEWSFGLGLSYAPGSSQAAGGPVIQSQSEKTDRRDDAWSPPPAPYGRLLGRRPSWYLSASTTTVEPPAVAEPGRLYGQGSIGGSVMWDRDRWGEHFAWTPAVSLAVGARRTSGESAYVTGVFGAGLRWYALGPLGLSVTAVRIEGGPKVRGQSEDDGSPDVHGSAGSQHYFQAGSRVGIVLTAGIVDVLIESPTLAWRSDPLNTREILSFSLAIRLN